ncbi:MULTISPECIES: NAD(P)/FAD-dependent oxidoreductase [Streptomyces]|uniref:FAD-dependent oxidoreductase n=2 Tax=Streptomyces TaxID=1883 RepID=A0ABU4KGA6_9ACTN|nr:FAD-dependent oxidoreductase [Streptomyces roseolus]MDX2296823.1 FAD-dependent oxidoreductase [Streptomyces roseolus]
MTDGHHIVVLGAGYTGMFTAIRLAHRTRRTAGVRITLVSPSGRFVERLRMHQIAAGQELAVHKIADLLDGTGVTFVQGAATALDPEARRITVDGSTTLGYDTLVYALGSATGTSRVPGAEAHAFTLDSPEVAGRFAARVAEVAAAGGTVTVCGAGLTGIEAAAELAEAHPGLRVTLIGTEEPGAMMGDKARGYLHRALNRLGVTRETGVRVAEVLPEAVELADGRLLRSDACLWTAGVTVSALAAEAGIATDPHGLILTDATLRSVSHPEIHAVGDAAAIRMDFGQLHGSCQSGLPTAQYTADTIARLVRGKTVQPFRFGYFHQPISLGRKDAVIQFTRADFTPVRMRLTGRSAVWYKEIVSGSPLMTYRYSKRMNLTTLVSKGGRATTNSSA